MLRKPIVDEVGEAVLLHAHDTTAAERAWPVDRGFVGCPVPPICVDGMDVDLRARVVEVEVKAVIAPRASSAGMQEDPRRGHRTAAVAGVLVTAIPAVFQRKRHSKGHLI